MFALLIASIALVPIQPGVVNDDRDVIQTALLNFFTPEDWHSADWKPKRKVVLRTQFQSKARPEFSAAMEALVQDMRYSVDSLEKYIDREKLAPKEVVRLRRELVNARARLSIAEDLRQRTWQGSYSPPDLIPLKSLTWDKRIMVTDDSNRLRSWQPNPKPNPNLENWTVEARTSRPSYSPDGRVAIVEFGIPWSIHSADVIFIFERTVLGWKRRVVHSIFYV